MKYSRLFGKTVKDIKKHHTTLSHKLLYQAGFVRESTAGHYYYLPLGERVRQKIISVIREEMNAAGAQELLSPVMHPISLWKETNRDKSVGFELTLVKDRRGSEYALGGTAEEMMIDLVRKFQLSYKDLPFNIYQFSIKFRDELRARGGLLRLREFTMKDAYSFHSNEKDFKKEYENMKRTYSTIFKKLRLKTDIVESDNGYIGGDYCHEFVVESNVGESTYLTTKSGSYAAHQDIACFKKERINTNESMKPIKKIKAKRGTTMKDGADFHKLPLNLQIKNVAFVDDKGRFILAVIRGDFDVNETKLSHLVNAFSLRHATDSEIRKILHSEPGFLSPVGIKKLADKKATLIIVADNSLKTIKNAYGGANIKNYDYININIGRDFTPDIQGDIGFAKHGYKSLSGEKLIEKKGIEVGNIFQLGYHYTKRMKNAFFIDHNGLQQPYYMGCYGIGIDRTLAAIVEVHHDDKGIIWPEICAPFTVHLISLSKNSALLKRTEKVYKALKDLNVEVLYDDRTNVTAGEKFADCDLIGIPYRLVISEKTKDKIELKKRNENKTQLVSFSQLRSFFTT